MHLAQLNIGRLVAPLTEPQLAGFVAELEPVNALADAAPGFVWRLQTEDGDATAIRPFEDDQLLVNMSVWRSVQALADFVYSGSHRAIMARRREWFVPMREAFQVLWWVPEDALPSVGDAVDRLAHLREHGPTPFAFTFRSPFPALGAAPIRRDEGWLCPT
jgi:heme-degrading monooxygenase HmoA